MLLTIISTIYTYRIIIIVTKNKLSKSFLFKNTYYYDEKNIKLWRFYDPNSQSKYALTELPKHVYSYYTTSNRMQYDIQHGYTVDCRHVTFDGFTICNNCVMWNDISVNEVGRTY